MWRRMKVGELGRVSSGGTPASKSQEYWNGDLLWYSSGELNEMYTLPSERRITDEGLGNSNAKMFPAGSLLIGMYDTAAMKMSILRNEATFNQAIVGIEPNEYATSEFLYYYLSSIKTKVLSERRGVRQQNLSLAKIKQIELALPPLADQQRIVTKLDAAFAEIDRAIEIERERTRQTDSFYESALNGLHDNDGAIVKLADVCGIEASLIDPKEPQYQQKKHVGAGNIVALSNDLIDVQTAEEEGLISGKYPFDASAVLYSKIRPYLRKVHMPDFEGICSADMYPLIPKSGKLSRVYLYYLLLSQHFTEYAMTGSARSGMPKVNRNHLFSYKFKLPPLERQIELADKVTAILQNVDEYKKAVLCKQRQLERLREAALARELQSEAA